MSQPPNAIQFLLGALKQEGISHVFMVPGGLLDGFLTEFGDVTGVNAIVAAHEGGAGFMADGYARASGRFGVCLGIGGPGAGNLGAALAHGYFDETPIPAPTREVRNKLESPRAVQDRRRSGMKHVGPMP